MCVALVQAKLAESHTSNPTKKHDKSVTSQW